MLRECRNAGFEPQGRWLWRRWVFRVGELSAARGMSSAAHRAAQAAQREQAVCVLADGARRYWWCLGRFFWEDAGLAADDVFALVHERRLRDRRRLERAHAVLDAAALLEPARREPVPREVRRAVFERDGGSCVQCGATFELQYDHVIPLALGGASTIANLQILCAHCNGRKGATL